ncbi:MAG: hypothetical protein ACLVH8_07765 [Fusobacterium sp.]
MTLFIFFVWLKVNEQIKNLINEIFNSSALLVVELLNSRSSPASTKEI